MARRDALACNKGAKRVRARTFTGCWTCRSRRVKCDERRPECGRCIRIGTQCQGYEMRFRWTQALQEQTSRPHRQASISNNTSRSTKSASLPPRRRSEGDDSDSIETTSEPSTARSFGCQNPQGAEFQDTPKSSDSCSLSLDESIVLITHFRHEEMTDVADTEAAGSVIESTSSSRRLSLDDISSRSSDDTSQEQDGRVVSEIVGQLDKALLVRWPSTSCQPLTRHLDLLLMPMHQRRLIHHWLTYLSVNVVLLDEPGNPCRTVILPMALRGLLSSSKESNAEITVFHAICACSAFNLYELTGRREEQEQVLALKHERLALTHLRHNLGDRKESKREALGLAIMICTVIDAVSGTPSRWRTHIAGGMAYLAHLRPQECEDSELSMTHQSLIYMAILCGWDVPPTLLSFLNPRAGRGNIVAIYGAPISFFHNLAVMNKMATSTAECQRAFDLDSFELELYLSFPCRNDPIDGRVSKQSADVSIHMANVFYYASLVFFQRTVRRVPLACTQDLVEKGISELEAIDIICNGSGGCANLWPVLVLAVECEGSDLQLRMHSWFEEKRKLGLRNILMIQRLTSSLWSRRSGTEEQSDLSWQELVSEGEFDVFRL